MIMPSLDWLDRWQTVLIFLPPRLFPFVFHTVASCSSSAWDGVSFPVAWVFGLPRSGDFDWSLSVLW